MPPINKHSIYLGEPMRALLLRRADGDSITASVNGAVARYLAVCRRSVPDLSRAEWCAILDALSGYGLVLDDGDDLAIRGIPLEVADAERLRAIGEKWDVDGEALAQRVAALSFAELAAVGEVAHAFWAHREEPTDEALRRALEEW